MKIQENRHCASLIEHDMMSPSNVMHCVRPGRMTFFLWTIEEEAEFGSRVFNYPSIV